MSTRFVISFSHLFIILCGNFCFSFFFQWGTKRKFLEDPATWWTDFWLKSHDTDEFLNARPSASHVAITQIVNAYPNARVVTQNVDRLHLKAGIDPSHLVEVHGAIGLYRCVNPFVIHSSIIIPSFDNMIVMFMFSFATETANIRQESTSLISRLSLMLTIELFLHTVLSADH